MYREFQEKQVKEKEVRAKKRLEFAELISRLQNQLDFERRRNTAGMYCTLVCVCALCTTLCVCVCVCV